jgi:hypothetical protein
MAPNNRAFDTKDYGDPVHAMIIAPEIAPKRNMTFKTA